MKFLIVLSLFFSTLSFADVIKRGDFNKVEWVTEANPGFLKIEGKGGYVEGDLTLGGLATGKFSVAMANFTTTNETRDKHMKQKYLEVIKYPTATFELDPTLLADHFDVKGKMTLHGVTKPVAGKGTLQSKDGMKVVTVTLNLVLTDFGIEIPSWMGVTVAKDVTITTMVGY